MEGEMETERPALTSSVVGVFDDAEEAQRALELLRADGLGPDDVSLMMRDAGTATEVLAQSTASPVAGGASAGATIGGLVGGLAGWMVAAGAIALPGVGMVVGAGALATTLAGLALGAAAGGIIGGLLGLGVPEEEAKAYEGHVQAGRVLLTVHPTATTTSARAVEVMEANGGYDVRVYEAPSEEEVYDNDIFPSSGADRTNQNLVYDEETGQYVPYSAAVASMTSQAHAQRVDSDTGSVAAESDALGAGAEGGTGSGEPLEVVEAFGASDAEMYAGAPTPEGDVAAQDVIMPPDAVDTAADASGIPAEDAASAALSDAADVSPAADEGSALSSNTYRVDAGVGQQDVAPMKEPGASDAASPEENGG